MSKIDFVITWVDGNDPEWRKEKNKYSGNTEGDAREVRFRDWDNLQFWFRGVEKFTPWVNKIHFVTWGHLPSWLNTDHPKLNIVRHEDYIPKEYLPTFNSHTIELNLHRIKGLEDKFVYFNDDTFIIQEMKEEDFFKNDLPRDIAVLMPNMPGFRNSTSPIVANMMEIINTRFDKRKVLKANLFKWFNPLYKKHLLSTLCMLPYRYFSSFFNPHLPNAYLKETFVELWESEKEILHKTCSNKFRGGRDVNQWLMRYWQLVNGKFVPRNVNVGMCFSLTNDNRGIVDVIQRQKYKMICINDNDREPIEDFEREKELIKQAFNLILPVKSSFEI